MPIVEQPVGFECSGCELLMEVPEARQIWASADRVYWVEYGSKDELGNYLRDGKLKSISTSDGAAALIAGGLAGPYSLAVSDSHAYVLLDRSNSTNGPRQLLQVSLANGVAREVGRLSDDSLPLSRRRFASHDHVVYFTDQSSTFRLDEATPNAELQRLEGLDQVLELVDANDDFLYLLSAEGISRVAWPSNLGDPPDGPELIFRSDGSNRRDLTVIGDSFYAHEWTAVGFGEDYVSRLPKQGGSFSRVAKTPTALAGLETDGSSFVASLIQSDHPDTSAPSYGGLTTKCAIIDGPIDQLPLATTLMGMLCSSNSHGWGLPLWDATDTDLYFALNDYLYRAPRSH